MLRLQNLHFRTLPSLSRCPSESSADAHLPVQEFTAAEIENAQRGVESLRLSGLLRPASAVNAPDPGGGPHPQGAAGARGGACR